jgi:hypothetical protein
MRLRSLFVFVPLALCARAVAQVDFDFTISQSTSNFSWSGTSSLGAIVGNPSNTFQFQGDTHMTLAPSGATPIASGDFPGLGDAKAVPDLHGKINNPIPFLPPLATIDVTNLHLKVTAPTFAIAPAGTFSATVTLTAIAGTLTVTPLGSSASNTDLTGQMSTPTAFNGTVTKTGNNLHLTLPVNSTFLFNDPTTGASGTINVTGTVNADWTCPAAQIYCTAKTNSLGCVPAIATSGMASYTSASAFTISASNTLNQKSGLLYYGFAASSAPFQGGIKCVASPTIRTAIQSSGGSPAGNDCTGAFTFDFNAHILSSIDPLLVPGEEVFAQYWSRDPASLSTTNLTNGARFTICP